MHRPAINNTIKKKLRAEAGGKCANPGCPNRRTHIHHIRKWTVYQTHDKKHMIAVCPACHDAIHHGRIELTDSIIYKWKSISRPSDSIRSHLYIEPGEPVMVLLGTIAFSSANGMIVFELSDSNKLKFTIRDQDILLLELSLFNIAGKEVIRVVDNHIRHQQLSDVNFLQVPGTVRLEVPSSAEFLPTWAINQFRMHEPNFGKSGTMIGIELSVVRPGIVSVQGVWPSDETAVIVTNQRLSFLSRNLTGPLSLIGQGENTVFNLIGPIKAGLFGFDVNALIQVGRRH